MSMSRLLSRACRRRDACSTNCFHQQPPIHAIGLPERLQQRDLKASTWTLSTQWFEGWLWLVQQKSVLGQLLQLFGWFVARVVFVVEEPEREHHTCFAVERAAAETTVTRENEATKSRRRTQRSRAFSLQRFNDVQVLVWQRRIGERLEGRGLCLRRCPSDDAAL
jgi:hypothetical protein